MKVIEHECAAIKVFPARPASSEERQPLTGDAGKARFEVDFKIAFVLQCDGVDLTHHVVVSTSVLPNGAFADRLWVEKTAARQLPDLLRETAVELEKAAMDNEVAEG
jgi:hypothetical protein